MDRKEIVNSQDYKAMKHALNWYNTKLTDEQREDMDIIDAYAEGVMFGWNYPNWISVEERLPEPHFKDSSSKWVLVSIEGSIFIDSYNQKHGKWCNNGNRVDHWMPLPQPPRKEE